MAAHRSAREAIRTLQARYRMEQVHPKAELMSEGVYVRRNNDALIHSGKVGEADGTILIQSGEVRAVTRKWQPGGATSFSASRMSGSRSLGLQDVWQRLLLSHAGTDSQPLPLEEFVRTATGPVRASARTTDGREVVTVSFAVGAGDARRDRTFELDAGVNYLIRKTTVAAPGVDDRTVAEVEEFRELKPGVFVPQRCRTIHSRGGKPVNEWVVELSDVRVNDPVPAERMTLPAIPPGTVLTDRMHQTRYPVDSAWNRIGAETSSPVLKVSAPAGESTDYTTQSPGEPRPLAHYVVAAAAALLAVAAAVWGTRRWRARSV